MPIKKSAKKSLRQSIRRKNKNLLYKVKIKNLLKQIRALISEKKAEEAKKLLPSVYKFLDKAAKSKVIKKNTAARKKARIAKKILKNILS